MKTMTLVRWIAATVLAMGVVHQVRADGVWVGGGADGNWGTAANWQDGTAVFGQDTVVTFYGAAANLTTYLGAGLTIGTLNFNADADAAVSILLNNGPGVAQNLTFSVSSGSASINIDAGATGAFTIGTDGRIVLTSNLVINHDGSGVLRFNRITQGAGSITKNGDGIFQLGNNGHSFSGGFYLNAGTLQLQGDNRVGATGSLLQLNGGRLSSAGANARLLDNVVEFNGAVALGDATNTGLLTFSGAASLLQNSVLTLDSDVVYNGAISGDYSLTKAGPGTLTLAGNNTWSGGTVINGGVLRFDSLSAVAGSGNNVTLNNGATVAAGFAAEQSFLYRLAPTANGVFALTANSAENFDMSDNLGGANQANLGLGAVGTVEYSGTLTPHGTVYLLGGGGGTLIMTQANALTGATSLSAFSHGSGGTLRLAAANNYSGGTVLHGVSGGNEALVQVGNNGALGSGGVLMKSNAKLMALPGGGSATLANNFTLEGGTVFFGRSGGGTDDSFLTLAGTVNLGGGTTTLSVRSSTLTLSGDVANGGIVFVGNSSSSNHLTLSGDNTFAGGVEMTTGGRLNINSATALGTGALTLNAVAINQLDNSSGAPVTLANNNALNLNQNFTFIGTHSLDFGSGAVTLGASVTITVNANMLTLGGAIGDGGNGYGLTKAGGGTLALSGNNTFTGNISLTSGTGNILSVGSDASLGGGTTVTLNQNTGLQATGSFATDRTFVMNGSGPKFIVDSGATLTLNGVLNATGSASPRKEGLGTLVLNNANNLYQAASVFVSTGGGVYLGHADALNGITLRFNAGSSRFDNVTGGAAQAGLAGFEITTGFEFVGSNDLDISGAQAGFTQTAGGSRTLTVTDKTLKMSGILGAGTSAGGTSFVDGALVKAGAGTLTLAGPSDYTGTTTVSAGTLKIEGANTSSSMAVNGGLLMMDGTYTTGLISVNADAILGGSGTVGDVSFVETGRLLFNASLSIADTYQVTFASPESFGLDNLVDAAGNPYSVWSAVVAPGTYTLLSGNVDWTGIDPVSADENNPLDIGNGKTAYLKQSSLQLVVIPEPGSLGALGLIALATILRRRLRR